MLLQQHVQDAARFVDEVAEDGMATGRDPHSADSQAEAGSSSKARSKKGWTRVSELSKRPGMPWYQTADAAESGAGRGPVQTFRDEPPATRRG